MPQTLASSQDSRYALLIQWLQTLPSSLALDLHSLQVASSDASFRRYFRLHNDKTSLIVMDAPPPQENIDAFLHVTELLAPTGVLVPTILAANQELGFILMSDLGTENFQQALKRPMEQTQLDRLYRRSLQVLVQAQSASTEGLAEYNQERLLEELQVFPEWFLAKHANIHLTEPQQKALQACFELLTAHNTESAQVIVLRDFHSPNLMMPLPGSEEPGLIDYQDALRGPITYDIASLLMDARHTWEEEQQLDWGIRYWQAAFSAGLPVPDDFAVFHQQYEWMGLQRCLRILGVFVRLSLRDGKHHYLDHLPRLMNYARQVASRYQDLSPILKILDLAEGRQTVLGITI